VREFKGKLLVDIREFYEKDGEMMPGKKGKYILTKKALLIRIVHLIILGKSKVDTNRLFITA